MKIKLILALLLICLNLNGRNSIDSLNILLVNTKSNVQKVDLYNQIGILKSDSSKFDGLMYFEQANILANKLNYRKGVVYSIYNSANVYYKYDFDSLAILFYESSLPFFVNYKDTLIFIEINRRLEFLYYRNFEYSKAILIDYKLLDYYKKQNNISKVIGCYISIGNFNLYKNKYFDAQENYWLALKLAMKYKIDSLISLSYGNIGLIHSLNGDFKVANDYFFKVLTVDQNLQNQNNYLIDLINIAKNYNASGDSILSLSYFEQSRIIAEKINAKQELSVILQEIGKLNFDKQKYKEARIVLKSSIEISKSINNYLGLGFGYFLIVRTMINLNQNKKEIFNYLQQGMYFANKANDLELNDNGYNANIEYYEWVGNEKEALKYYKLLVDNKELLSSKSKLKDVSKLEIKFEMEQESEKKQREIDLLNENKKQQSIINYILVIGFVLIFLFAFFIFRSSQKQRKSNELISNQKNIIEDALRAKNKFFNLISHDLKNPIYNFHSLTELMSQNYDMLSDEDKFRHLNSLTSSSKSVVNLLDNLLTWSRIQNGTITTNPEILDIKDLVISEIENIKHIADAKKIGLINEILTTSLIYCDKEMVMTIIRNLISNAIKFTNENGSITISLIEDDNNLNISIKDTGVGIKDEDKTKIFNLDSDLSKLGTANEKGTGLGLNLCKDFVELNFGSIWFESKVGFGTTFTFSLPLAELE